MVCGLGVVVLGLGLGLGLWLASCHMRIGVKIWRLGSVGWGLGCGWWVVSMHTYCKFIHKFLMMLFLVTLLCCLPAWNSV